MSPAIGRWLGLSASFFVGETLTVLTIRSFFNREEGLATRPIIFVNDDVMEILENECRATLSCLKTGFLWVEGG